MCICVDQERGGVGIDTLRRSLVRGRESPELTKRIHNVRTKRGDNVRNRETKDYWSCAQTEKDHLTFRDFSAPD